eukprot:gnl/TRDRNA2_/TRDRNA2_190254_c0_seq1.p1 gnl/TRDRNA2_/TRDRNA2_190254_c0~~gnl/TRDRNA2_/TRDRNA2_190254_c0_seq1.p1  ORF type:complete len:231 (+),score=57.69 gnl/TRDRNA2_/TRDRNA2_190254_c0_seq1:57-749(+)
METDRGEKRPSENGNVDAALALAAAKRRALEEAKKAALAAVATVEEEAKPASPPPPDADEAEEHEAPGAEEAEEEEDPEVVAERERLEMEERMRREPIVDDLDSGIMGFLRNQSAGAIGKMLASEDTSVGRKAGAVAAQSTAAIDAEVAAQLKPQPSPETMHSPSPPPSPSPSPEPDEWISLAETRADKSSKPALFAAFKAVVGAAPGSLAALAAAHGPNDPPRLFSGRW